MITLREEELALKIHQILTFRDSNLVFFTKYGLSQDCGLILSLVVECWISIGIHKYIIYPYNEINYGKNKGNKYSEHLTFQLFEYILLSSMLLRLFTPSLCGRNTTDNVMLFYISFQIHIP